MPRGAAPAIARLGRQWKSEYEERYRRELDGDCFDLWADRVYSGLRAEGSSYAPRLSLCLERHPPRPA